MVESIAFNQRVLGLTPALHGDVGTFGQVLNSQLTVAHRRETLAQYPCCVRSASE